SVSLADNVRTIDIPPSMAWLPGEKFGYFTITGVVTEMGGDFRLPRNDYLTSWQLGDTPFWTRGAHAAKFGFQSQMIQFHQNTTSQQGGIVTFPNLAAFLQGQPSNVDFAVPGLIDPIRDYKQWLFGFFAQDDVRMRSNVSLNLGLRYEFITTPTEVNGKISNLRSITDAALTVGDPWHSNPSLKNVAPRLGIAWDPGGKGTTSVRAGFGLFYDEILPKYYFFSGSLNPPFTTRTTIVNRVKTYLPQLGRRNPNFGPVFQRVTDARSFYDSMQLSVMKRYSRGLRAQVSYTLAKSIDDSSGINSQDFDNNVQYVLDWYD